MLALRFRTHHTRGYTPLTVVEADPQGSASTVWRVARGGLNGHREARRFLYREGDLNPHGLAPNGF